MNTATMTMTNICKIIRKSGFATVVVKGEPIEVGFQGTDKAGTVTMLGGGYYTIRHTDGRKFDIAKGEHVTVAV